jgi:hypothetical protein
MTSIPPSEHARTIEAVPRARRILADFVLRSTSEVDLLAEVEDRAIVVARYQADLAEGCFTDADEEQRLRGGIAYETHRIELLAEELKRRERAQRYGYRANSAEAEPNLPARFAALRLSGAEELADLIGQETSQPGRKAANRWCFRCPFHGGGVERTASLVVFPDGRAHCFGCFWSGDGADFLADYRGMSAVAALQLLERGLA